MTKPIEERLHEALEAREVAMSGDVARSGVDGADTGDDARLLADQVALARALRAFRPEASGAARQRGLQAILTLGRAQGRAAARDKRSGTPRLRPALRLAALLLALTVGLGPMVSLAAPGQALYPLRQAATQLLRRAAGALGLRFAERGDQEEPVEGRSGPADGGLPASAPTSLDDGGPPTSIGDGAPDDAPGARAVAGLGPRDAGRDRALPPSAATRRATATLVGTRSAGVWLRATTAAGTAAPPTPTLDPRDIQGSPTTVPPAAGQETDPATAIPTRRTRETPGPSATARASAPPDPTSTAPPDPSPSTPPATASPSEPPPATATVTSAPPTATVTAAPPTATATVDPGACDAVVAGQVSRVDGGSVLGAEVLVIRVDLPDDAWSVVGVDGAGRFEAPGLCAGDYLAAALLLDGPEGAWDGVHDADGDGDPDVLALATGARRLGVDITLRLSPAGEPQSPACPGPSSTLSAALADEDDRPLPGALLHLFGPLGPVYEAAADASGRVDLGGICPGFYQAAATFEGGPATLLGFYDPDDDGQPDWLDLSDPGAGGAMLRIRLRPVLAEPASEGRAP